VKILLKQWLLFLWSLSAFNAIKKIPQKYWRDVDNLSFSIVVRGKIMLYCKQKYLLYIYKLVYYMILALENILRQDFFRLFKSSVDVV